MNFEKDGFLSLWLFLRKQEHVDNSLIKEDFGVITFDEDMLEVGGSDDWNKMQLHEVFSPMSYSESWKTNALKLANDQGITECLRAFFILNFAYNPKTIKKSIPDDPLFLGVFEFDDSDDLL